MSRKPSTESAPEHAVPTLTVSGTPVAWCTDRIPGCPVSDTPNGRRWTTLASALLVASVNDCITPGMMLRYSAGHISTRKTSAALRRQNQLTP